MRSVALSGLISPMRGESHAVGNLVKIHKNSGYPKLFLCTTRPRYIPGRQVFVVRAYRVGLITEVWAKLAMPQWLSPLTRRQ